MLHRIETLKKISEAPGRRTIVKGDMDCGYFGSILADDFGYFDTSRGARLDIYNIALRSGISPSEIYPGNIDYWHIFAWQGEIVYISQKPVAGKISWKMLSAGAVFGNRDLRLGGHRYRVTLLKGWKSDFTSTLTLDPESEYVRLYLGLHESAGEKGWGTNYTSQQMGLNGTRGSKIWLQELVEPEKEGGYRAYASGPNGDVAGKEKIETATEIMGWLPALRLLY